MLVLIKKYSLAFLVMAIMKVGVILGLELSLGVLHKVKLDIDEHALEVVPILGYKLSHHANVVAVQLFMAFLIFHFFLIFQGKNFCEVGFRHFRGFFLWFSFVI